MTGIGRAWLGRAIVALAAVGVAVVSGEGCGGGGSTADAGTDATAACGASGTLCSGSCVNLETDNANCGACATACGSGQVCSQGKCGTSCGGGTSLCGSSCADTKIDPGNCGSCGTKCGSGEVCSAGHCGTSCGSGQTFCGGDAGAPYCANTKTDNANCGGCGVACGTAQVCIGGACKSSCGGDDAGAETLCTPDGGQPFCANTQTDNANCGACGVACGSGQACQNGACVNDCASSDGGLLTLCTPDAGAAYCTDTQSDPSNCGGCGTTCGQNVCVGGACVSRPVVTGNYAAFVTASQGFGQSNVLYPGDVVTETNNWGGFWFQLGKSVVSVDVAITGAGGSSVGSNKGGGPGTGTLNLTPAFLASQAQPGFWIILGQAGKPSAGGSGGTTSYRAFNGGGAATDWSNGQNTYTYAAGGGGGSDVRFTFNGSTTTPQSGGDPTLSFASRFAVVGGGGGATANTAAGGLGGGFNLAGGNGSVCCNAPFGTGATTSAGGNINGALGLGGDGLQDNTEGWAGGGGGGYYGGGAASAHGGGGGGSGYLMTATGLTQVSTSSGTQGGNATDTENGAFTVTVH